MVLALAGVLVTGACEEEEGVVGADGEQYRELIAGPQTLDLIVGDVTSLAASLIAQSGSAVDANQAGLKVQWTSGNKAVVDVDEFGRLSAVAPGQTSIIARYQELVGSATIRVRARPSRIQLSSASFQGSAGQPVPGGVGVQVLDGSNNPVAGLPVRFTIVSGDGSVSPSQTPTGNDGRASTTWTLGRSVGRHALQIDVLRGAQAATAPSAPAVIGNESLPANAVGDANEVLASTVVFADVQGSAASHVVLSPASATMRGGEVRVFSARVVDAFGNEVGDQSVTFGSTNGNIVSVTSGGTAVAKLVGTASVTASSTSNPSVQGSAEVTVTPGPAQALVKIGGDGQFGLTGAALSQPLVVELRDGGGNPIANQPIAWSVSGGTLSASSTPTGPDGRAQVVFTLGSSAGSYTATASVASLYPAVFTATAATSPTIATSSLASGTVGVAYSQTLSANGGGGPYSWSLTSGSLPAGLSLNASTGTISGTPTTAGTSSFTVQVWSAGQTATRALSITIANPGVDITTTSLPNAIVNAPYNQQLAATGGSGPLAWSISAGLLPAGLSLSSSTGAITGTPTTTGTSNFTVTATDGSLSDSQPLSITVIQGVDITTTSLPDGQVGTAYSQTLSAVGGSGSYTWTITAGSLPAGLSLNGSTGAITGTPSSAGTSNFTVQATSGSLSDTQALSINVVVTYTAPTITTTSVPNGAVGVAYSQTLGVSGGDGNNSWSVVAGSLPAGLSLNPTSGTISGTPSATGTSNFTAQVTSVGQSDTQPLSITIYAPVDITTSSLPNGVTGTAYSQTLAATGGTGSFAWSITNGSLPAGLSLNPSTGAITGTPSAAGTATFTVQASSGGLSDSQTLSITVYAPVNITTTTLPNATRGVAYSQTLAATGGSGSYTWSITAGALPAGLTLNAGTGTISGSPTTVGGPTNFTVQATSASLSDTQALAITVVQQAVTITTPSPLPSGTQNSAYSTTLAATGGDGSTYAWSITAGSLPAGLTLNAGTGAISGTPTGTGTSSFTVQASSGGNSTTKAFSLTINPVGGPGPVVNINFDGYANTAALKADCTATRQTGRFYCPEDAESVGGPGEIASINLDASVASPVGSKTMRYDYQHGGNGCTSITIGRAVRIAPAVQEAWAEFYVRWSPNFRTTNNSCAPNDHKLIFGDTESDGSGRWAFYVGADSGPLHSIQVERPKGPAGFTGAYYMNNDPTDHTPNPDMWNGNWHVIRLYYRHSTTTSSNDGAMKVWIDGELTHSESGFNTVSDTGAPERLEGFSFTHNKDDGPPGELMSVWWGRIQMFTTNPGW